MISAIKLLLLSQISFIEYTVRAGGLEATGRFVPSTEEILLSGDELTEIDAARKLMAKEENNDKSEDKSDDDEGSSSDDTASSGSDSDDDKSDNDSGDDTKEKSEKPSKKAEPAKKQEAPAQQTPGRDQYGRDPKGEYLNHGTYTKSRDALNAEEKVHEDMFFNIKDKLNDAEYVSTVAAKQRAEKEAVPAGASTLQIQSENMLKSQKDGRTFIWGGMDAPSTDQGGKTPPPTVVQTRKDGEAPAALTP